MVCPTHAILSGDLDDSNSTISKRIAMEKVSVRKVEKGTKPKLFYAGVDGDLLNPTMMEPQATHFWADKDPGEDLYALKTKRTDRSIPGAARSVRRAPRDAVDKVSYLWTKSISTGVLLRVGAVAQYRFERDGILLSVFGPAFSLRTTATMVLLVLDLKKPGRFSIC